MVVDDERATERTPGAVAAGAPREHGRLGRGKGEADGGAAAGLCLTTVFAGQDVEATTKARSYFTGYPPSSPQIGLLKDGQVVFMLERWQIEGRSADDIAKDLVGAFDQFCAQQPAGRV